MMVARDDEAYRSETESDNVIANGVVEVEQKEKLAFVCAEDEIPEFQKQLLVAKQSMADVADMYQKDYLDKVEQRADLAKEAKLKAVSCLVDVSEKIFNLAGCFQQLLEDQVDKLQEIENMTVSVKASLEITSCYNFRNELHSRLPTANIPSRQFRIGRPESLQPEDFFKENVAWEKLNYNKYDKLGAGHVEDMDQEFNSGKSGDISTSQHSLQSVGSSTKSYVTASSITSPNPPAPAAPPCSISHVSTGSDMRLSVSSGDPRPPSSPAEPRRSGSPAMIRYGSSNSLTSLNSSQSEVKSITMSNRHPARRSLSSLKIQPARAAPAPPPAKMNPNRQRVYSVKNQTGEGLEKPSMPAPRPPIPEEEEDHYAVPPSIRQPAQKDEVIYDDVRAVSSRVVAPSPCGQQQPQYQRIVVTPEVPPPPPPPPDDDELYTENDMLPAPDMVLDDELPPPPPDILPPPPLSPTLQEGDDEDMYTDMMGGVMQDDDIYTENVVDPTDIAKAHTVSVSKDSGFYTEEQEEDDPVLETVRAIYPYAATASDELNLAVGDLIAVHVKNPDGWYEGTHNGIRGLFPGNYVESME